MTDERNDRSRYTFTVARVTELPDEALVVLEAVQGEDVVLDMDDYVAMMIALGAAHRLPLHTIDLVGLTLVLDPSGVPRLFE